MKNKISMLCTTLLSAIVLVTTAAERQDDGWDLWNAAIGIQTDVNSPTWATVLQPDTIVGYFVVSNVESKTLVESGGSKLAAFAANGECRGVVEVAEGPKGKCYMLSIGIANSTETGLTLKFWDALLKTTYDVNDYVIDAAAVNEQQIGRLVEPVIITIGQTVEPVVMHTVTFDLGAHGTRTGGGALTQTIEDGSAATAPTLTVAEGWKFTGWDKSFDVVTSDLTVTALYEETTEYEIDGPHKETVEGIEWTPVTQPDTITGYFVVSNVARGTFVETEGSKLGVFAANGECRGVAGLIDGPSGKLFSISIGVASSTESGLTLKCWDAATQQTNAVNSYVIDAATAGEQIGRLLAPQLITVGETTADPTDPDPDPDPIVPETIAFEESEIYAEKGGKFVLTVNGGSIDAAVSVQLNIAYVTAKASDLILNTAAARVESTNGLERDIGSFPLTLNWEKGDTEPKTITIPVKEGKVKDAPKFLTLTLTNSQGMELGNPAYCIGKIEAGDDYVDESVTVMPYVVDPVGGKVSGGKNIKPDARGDYKTVTLKATPNKGYWFAGWYDTEGALASCEASFKATPDGSEESALAYEARFVKADTTFCGTYSGLARVNLNGMTIVKGADTMGDVCGLYPATVTLSTAGKISGSITVGGKKATFKDGACVALANVVGAEFKAVIDEKVWFGQANSEMLDIWLNQEGSSIITAEEYAGDYAPLSEDEESTAFVYKALGKDASSREMAQKFAGTYSVSIPDDEGGLTVFSVSIDAKGKAKVTGRFRDGKSLSYSGALCGCGEYEDGDGSTMSYAQLNFVVTPKSLGAGSCAVSLSLMKSDDGENGVLGLATASIAAYTKNWFEGISLADSATVLPYKSGCWVPEDIDPSRGMLVIELEDDTVEIPLTMKNGTVTGLGKPQSKGYTLKFDNKTGLFELKKGKTYTVHGLFTSGGVVAACIAADGTFSDVLISFTEQ